MQPLRLGVFTGIQKLLDNRDARKEREESRRLALEDRQRALEDRESRNKRENLSLELALRGSGYVPESEAQPDPQVSGKTLDDVVSGATGRRTVGLSGTPTRYDGGPQGYRYDRMSPHARSKQLEQRLKEAQLRAVENPEPKEASWQVLPDRGVRVQPGTGRVEPLRDLPKPPPEPPKPVDVPDVSFKFNERFRNNPTIKAAEEMVGQTAMLEEIKGGTPMGAGDIAIIIGFNKVLDPGAVVREGDVVLAQSAASLKGRLETFIANAKEGTKMDPKLRQDMIDVATRLAQVRLTKARAVAEEFRNMTKKYGGDPDMTTMGYGFLFEQPGGGTAPPAPVGVGGDTASPAVWLENHRKRPRP